jgi:hypothetical protein
MFGRLQLITTSISASIGTRPPSLNTPLPMIPVLGHDASFLGTSLLPIYRYNSIQSQVQDSDSEEEGGGRLEFGSFLSRDYTFHTLFPCTATATYSKRITLPSWSMRNLGLGRFAHASLPVVVIVGLVLHLENCWDRGATFGTVT